MQSIPDIHNCDAKDGWRDAPRDGLRDASYCTLGAEPEALT